MCDACGIHGMRIEYITVRVVNGGLRLCRPCLDEINGKNPDLQRIIACASHVGAGKTAGEICDGVIRQHDRIVELQDAGTEMLALIEADCFSEFRWQNKASIDADIARWRAALAPEAQV